MKQKSSNQMANINIKVIAKLTTIISIIFSVLGILIYELWFMGIFGVVSFGVLIYLEKYEKSVNSNLVWMYVIGIILCIFTTICLSFMLGRSFIGLVI